MVVEEAVWAKQGRIVDGSVSCWQQGQWAEAKGGEVACRQWSWVEVGDSGERGHARRYSTHKYMLYVAFDMVLVGAFHISYDWQA